MKRAVAGLLFILCLAVSGCSASSNDSAEPISTPKATPLDNPDNKGVTCDDAGCHIDETRPDGERQGSYPETEEAKQMLADSRLTREEYERAFGNYVTCMDELGYTVSVADTSAKHINYTTPGGEAERFCYDTHFFSVDRFWQTYEQPRESAAPGIQRYIDCLKDAGIKPLTEEIPEDWREQVYLYDDIEEQTIDAWESGLLTPAQEDACFKSPS